MGGASNVLSSTRSLDGTWELIPIILAHRKNASSRPA